MNKRIDYLDNTKSFLITLVIIHHLAITFGASGSWYFQVQDPSRATHYFLTLVTGINQSFFMSLFFFISAYFSPASYDKKGFRRFITDRLLRLGVPFVIYLFVFSPILIYLVAILSGHTSLSFWGYINLRYWHMLSPGPLWFIEALFIFTFIYTLFRLLFNTLTFNNIAFPNVIKTISFCVLIAAITFFIRLAYPPGKTIAFLQLGYFPMYIAFYSLGLIAYRHQWLDHINLQKIKPLIVFAVLLILFFATLVKFVFSHDLLPETLGGWHVLSAALSLWESVACVTFSFITLALFKAYRNNTTRLSKLASNSAYTVYIIHPFFCVLFSFAVLSLQLPNLIGWLLTLLITIPIVFISANFIRRIPGFSQIL